MKNFLFENVKNCTKEELIDVCETLREIIYQTVSEHGGHLSSNLGAIESTVALFHVFDFPKDKIVFDVGHQCYAYKLLSGRADRFSTLRQAGGISGFPKRSESVYDSYDTGHAGTSVSAALGLAKARDLNGDNHFVIAYIGDGSFQNGLVYEALNSLKTLKTNVLIVLNDNDMSISPTIGGMHDVLSSAKIEKNAESIRLLESFGVTYLGVKDGNNVEEMVEALTEAKELLHNRSVLLHIATTKGKGYAFCEKDPTNTHGVSPVGTRKEKEYSEVLGETLCELASKNEKIVAVSAAMKESLGLENFFKQYPQRAFDVGICEENAAVLGAAMACGGLKPYYAIYSTFLQRAFDEIIHDVCSQNAPVTFCIDRAGISGADGETHQGVFDLSYLSLIPNLTIAAPKDTEEFKKLLKCSQTYARPLAIRYPRYGKVVFSDGEKPFEMEKWEYLYREKAKTPCATVLATGERSLTLAMQILQNMQKKGLSFDVVNARFIKPLDAELLKNITTSHIVTIEDNVLLGGFGSNVALALQDMKKECTLKIFAYRDEFIPQGKVQDLQNEYGVNERKIEEYLTEVSK